MRGKLGTVCMLLGTVLLLAALSLFGWNQWEAEAAGESAAEVLAQVTAQVQPSGAAPAEPYVPQDPAMTEVEIDGYAYIGYISIPVLDIELPVMSQWDYTRLKIAPCRYTGSTRTNDLVLCAHNYIRHFGPIRRLTPGDQVYFTDMDGVVWSYEVAVVEVLEPTAIEDMTSGEYDLTLFTCTYGGATRVTVRCVRVE